jgi:cell division septation protein DedD
MKIVCMDCQTESHVDVELLKDKKRFECEHCSKNPPVGSTDQMEKQIHPFADDTVDFQAVSASESPSEKGISLYNEDEVLVGEDEVLEIPPISSLPETPQSSEMDEIISVPFYELQGASSDEDSNDVFIDVTPTKVETFAPEIPRQLPQTFVPVVEASTQTPDSSNFCLLAEETLQEQPSQPGGVKVLTVKTSILMGIAAVFVLFIALGDKIIRPAVKPSPETKNSLPVIKPEREIKPPIPVASSVQPETIKPVQPEPAKPIPTPAAPVVETKPVDVPLPTNQPPAVTAKGQFTVQVGSHNDVGQANEQALKLRAAGFEPRVVSVDIPKRGRWYRVQSGNFSDRDEANRYGAQILAKGAAENFVIAGL